MKNFRCVTLLLGALLMTNGTTASAKEWGYTQENGPATWSKHYPVCANGKEQSPIDIKTKDIRDNKNLPTLVISTTDTPLNIQDNGHTIQVDVTAKNTVQIGAKTYHVKQFHFHRPSEHTINGNAYPMEAHIVSAADDGELAVVGIFIEEGKENSLIKTIWENLPSQRMKEIKESGQVDLGKLVPSQFNINIRDLLPSSLNYYHLKGSLTTPPCTEGVKWYVLPTPISASVAQIKTFSELYVNNARPVQPLHDRVVEKN